MVIALVVTPRVNGVFILILVNFLVIRIRSYSTFLPAIISVLMEIQERRYGAELIMDHALLGITRVSYVQVKNHLMVRENARL